MPRVRVSSPDSEAIKLHPRAFALLHQLSPKGDGEVDAKVLEEFATRYGEGKLGATGDALTFDQFAALFKTPAFPSPPDSQTGDCVGYAALDKSGHITPFRFARRATGACDVRIQITHSGICHSDLHQVKNEWHNSTFPMVPGHEIVGIVTEIGSGVSRFKTGDRVGVGCLVNSCQDCDFCLKTKEEQFCSKGVFTYNSQEADGTPTQGGYSTHIVVNDRFVLRVPDALAMERAAPLLCAGITVYSPLRHFGLDKPGMRVGVAGLGGLGHMAVKIAAAMGVEVTVLSTSLKKKAEACGLGAKRFIVTSNPEEMVAAAGSLDGIINCISAHHDIGAYCALMKVDGTMVCLGVPPPENPIPLPAMALLFRRQTISGSLIGGIKETQEMLDFCAKHAIMPECETIKADYINTAYERMVKNDVHYRFVIDVQGSIVL